MDEIKQNQGTENRRKIYFLLKNHPELAKDLALIMEEAYDKLLDALYARCDEEAKKEGLPPSEEANTDFSMLQDFLTTIMEEDMAWPNLVASGNQMYEDWEEDDKEQFIRELSAINQPYWTTDENGVWYECDCYGNKTGKTDDRPGLIPGLV